MQKTLAGLRAEITQQIAQGGDELPPTFSFVEKLGDQLVEVLVEIVVLLVFSIEL